MNELGTPRFAFPLLAAGQAQKEMFHNEALCAVDLLVHAAAEGIASTPPADPQPGQCWIVGPDPTGAWDGHAHAIAGWTEGGWRFASPREGMRAWLGAEAGWALFRSGAWHLGEAHGTLFVGGRQVVGERKMPIAEPTGGTVVDAAAREAILAVLTALRDHGLIEI